MLAATAVYGQESHISSITDQSIQSQIIELQKEITALQTNQDGMVKSAAPTQTKLSSVKTLETELEKSNHVNVPTNVGHIQRFLLSDVHENITPIGMLGSSQFALGLLKQRNIYSNRALIFGSYLEADPQVSKNSSAKYNKGTNLSPVHQNNQLGNGISITTANLYITGNLGRYISAETTLAADPSNGYNINTQEAFVMFGNIDDFPLYATLGKNRLTLGSFSGGGPRTGSLTQVLFRPSHVNNLSLAYYKDGLSSNVTLFHTKDHTSNFVYTAFYSSSTGKWLYSINGGYVYDVNGTGNKSFDLATNSDLNKTSIGAINFDASLNYGIYGVGSGLAQTTKKSNMTNNGYAGAWYVQASLSPEVCGRLTKFNIAYNRAYNTQNLPIALSDRMQNDHITLPKDNTSNNAAAFTYPGSGVNKMVIAFVQRPFFTENLLLGLEYAYMHMYNNQHTNTYTLDISVHF